MSLWFENEIKLGTFLLWISITNPSTISLDKNVISIGCKIKIRLNYGSRISNILPMTC